MSQSSQTVDPSEYSTDIKSEDLSRAFPEQFSDTSSGKVNVKTNSLKLKKLAGDASSRRYYRIYNNNNHITQNTEPDTLILQVSEPFQGKDFSQHPFIAAQALLNSLQVPVPSIYAVAAESGWVLLEDLGDETLQNQLSNSETSSETLDLYKKSVDLIIEWLLRAPGLNSNQPHFSWAFDFEKLNFEMNFAAEHLVGPLLHRSPSKFLQLTKANSLYLAGRPRFFCHRDYHSRNIMVRDKKIFVIDFQDARMGPITYDLVSLLWDPYVRLSESWRFELLRYWNENLSRRAQQLHNRHVMQILGAHDHPWEHELERMKVQRLLKAAGSYASFYNKKGRTDYLPALIPAVTDAIQALEKLNAWGLNVPEDAELLTELKEWLPLLPDILKLK